MGVIRKNLIRDGVDIFAGVVLRDRQLNQIRALERRSVNGIRPVLLNPGQDICEVENRAGLRTDGMLEGLQRERAELEG